MWNSIFLPSITSPPKFLTFYNLSTKGFKTKTFPLSRAIFGGAQGLPTFFHGLEWVARGGRRCYISFIWGAFVGAAGDWAAPTNRSYKYEAIFRDGSITSRPYKWPTYKPNCSTFFLLRSLTPIRERKVGRPWAPNKTCSTKGKGFGLKSFGGDVVEGKKMLFHTFLKF